MIAVVTGVETFLKIKFENTLLSVLKDVVSVYLVPSDQKFDLIKEDVRRQYFKV
jgi:hypothetical protein